MALGIPRAEMLSRMSSAELTEWIAFAQLEPFGSEAYYLGHAITATTVANVNRSKNTKAHKVTEFMPNFKKQQASSPEQMLQLAEMYTIGLGGKDLRGSKHGT